MTKFIIEDNFYLGDTPNGPSISYGRSEIELNKNEINLLISLIKEKNSSDVNELNLGNYNPELYRKLYEATCEAVKMANEDL